MQEQTALQRAARRLGARRPGKKAIPTLLAFTDPDRSGDILELAARLPRGSALIYRAFGAADAQAVAWRLRRITWRRGVLLLIGADEGLAQRVKADGLHLPERLAHRLPYVTRAVTVAAHSPAAARRALARGADAVVLSPALSSDSPSAGKPIGVLRLAGIVRGLSGPAYALGGIDGSNARRVGATGVAGLAAVGAFAALRT